MICVSGQSKSRPVKAAGAESCGQRRNQKLHAAVAKSTFGSEHVQNMTCSEHFAAVARPTFGSESVQNTSAADSFLKF